ncbi:MAG: hypothetical protein Q8M18_13710 [Bradyrhizobium sp.]|nr:hypothetical protein [Bradyrhizobium sp.]
MRIFERLQGRDLSKVKVERKLVETIVDDLLRRVERGMPVAASAESKSTCCSWCSGEEKADY